MRKAKVTLYLDEQLWREFRAACVRRGKSASEVVELRVHDQMLTWVAEELVRSAVRSEAQPSDPIGGEGRDTAEK